MISQYAGQDIETLGKFLPGLKKTFKKIGKVTSPITTKIAKTFLPSSFVEAAAAVDPTKGMKQARKSAADLLKPPPAPVKKPVKKLSAVSPAVIGIGVAALGALFLLGKRR